ncbi:hypothetical protein BG011_003415 [Mortierella polycephala]|uniref:Ion transport domain-containing protein n=1 Tax=Mortierella polycephala TaxID=41804 RepID=A0A9P6Q0X3_9FUNG|nr:hypothetical protein BG011_003415 [Mortierella polycephala]
MPNIRKCGFHDAFSFIVDKGESADEYTIRMTVAKGARALSDENPGFLHMHFMELRPFRTEGYADDSLLVVHRPYLWSVNVKTAKCFSEDGIQFTPQTIHSLTISGNGRHAATLASTKIPLTFLLNIWDLNGQVNNAAVNAGSPTISRTNPLQFSSRSCIGRVITMPAQFGAERNINFILSLSWDGSKVAVGERLNGRQGVQPSVFAISHRESDVQHSGTIQHSNSSTVVTSLQPSADHQQCTELKNFRGYGLFHLINRQSPDVKNELFVACDEERVLIYRIHRKWSLLHTISIGYSLINWRILGHQEKHLAVVEPEYGMISVRNIELGCITSVISGGETFLGQTYDTAIFSSDGEIVVVYRARKEGVVASYRTASGTELGSYKMPHSSYVIDSLQFIEDDTQIMISSKRGVIEDSQGINGIILEVPTMTVVDTFFIPQACAASIVPESGSGTTFYSAHGTTLDLAQSYIHPRVNCTDKCLKNLTPLENSQLIIAEDRPTRFTAPSGIHYQLEMQERYDPSGSYTSPWVLLSITSRDNTRSRRLTIPTWDTGRIVVFDTTLRLVDTSCTAIIIWRLPESMEGDFKLEVIRVLDALPRWMTCVHCEIYAIIEDMVDTDKDQDQNRNVDMVQPFRVERGVTFKKLEEELFSLAGFFEGVDTSGLGAFVDYVIPHINSFFDPENPSDTLLATLCRNWDYVDTDTSIQFLRALLASPSMRLTLSPDTELSFNPLWIVLEIAKTEPPLMCIANSIVDNCFCRARAEKDLDLLFPVLQCLHALVDPNILHTTLAAQVLQRFGHLPVKSRSFVIDHHVIVHPPTFPWLVRKASELRLYECQGPILQRVDDVKSDALNKNFTREICVAPFALLWRYKGDIVYWSAHPVTPSRMTLPWIRVLVALIWYKCKPRVEEHVKCHDFSLEMLDNPAIAALVEYKWNTMGFKYCMIRFFFQCCYYLLVLTVVFLQVYGGFHGTLFGAFIAIAICSVLFLWLELIQVFRSWKYYFSSMYNVVDWFVFGLPLVASINHILFTLRTLKEDTSQDMTPQDANAWFLSFSVLFIFLHFLFELRINRSVCKFVTIIIRVFFRIRLFFFISIGGILAFSIAILHLLHSCPYKSCRRDSRFPSHFYGAVSATILYMGGRYDSIEDELNSENWPFQTLMMLFFFFTVVVMLNVLIALINKAFIDGDETWRLEWLENRLRVIESVENLTFHIPGFREHYNWFPNEIYYTATTREIDDYRAKYSTDDLGSGTKKNMSSELTAVEPESHNTKQADLEAAAATAAATVEKTMQELREQLKEQMQTQMVALQGQVQASVEKKAAALQEQNMVLQEQNTLLQEQMKALNSMLSTLVATKVAAGSS